MSKYGYCPRGGEDGILVTTEEMVKFAKEAAMEFMDEYIPLPKLTVGMQLKRINECSCSNHDETYWERENGKHGWCCPNCGAVTQWG